MKVSKSQGYKELNRYYLDMDGPEAGTLQGLAHGLASVRPVVCEGVVTLRATKTVRHEVPNSGLPLPIEGVP